MSDDDTEDSAYLYKDKFRRPCCAHGKIVDHSKPLWKPNFNWVRHDVTIPCNKKGKSKLEEPAYVKKV